MKLTKEGAWTGVLVILMLLTGTVNTIATKYQDIQCVEYNAKNECVKRFEHFAVQSAEMFLGEMLCLIPAVLGSVYNWVFGDKDKDINQPGGSGSAGGNSKWMALLSFAVPAMCDVSGTTLLNVGIFFTYPSVYQMLRGTVVFFAGMFTITLLGRKLSTAQWFSLVLIVFGAGIVGSVSVIHIGKGGGGNSSNVDATNPLLGNILVVSAQLAAAFQFIIEEKYLSKYGVKPHIAVGFEGIWGFLACMILLPIMQQVKVGGTPFDSLPVAIEQIKASRPLLIATLGSIFSIAFFNFFGITLTKRLSGASRATIDACRTLFVWMYSLHVGWEEKGLIKNLLQVVGFIILISGTSMFNGIIRGPGDKKKEKRRPLPHLVGDDMDEPLLPSSLGKVKTTSEGNGTKNGFPMRRLVSNTMARSFRLGRSLLSSMSPAGSRASSAANTPVQTPRYRDGEPSSMVLGSSVHNRSFTSNQDLPSSYESKVKLYDDGDNSPSDDLVGSGSNANHLRQGSNSDESMDEPFE